MTTARNVIITFVAQVLLLSAASAQDSFGVSDFVPGLPEFPPVRQWLVSNQSFATIPMGDTVGTVYICRGTQNDSTGAFVMLVRSPEGVFLISWLDLSLQPDGSFRSDVDIRSFHNPATYFPLEIQVFTKRIKFRWILSNQATPPGGIPIPAEVTIAKGKAFPNLRLVALDGAEIACSSFRGMITVINSWSTGCVPCVEEIPGFNKLVNKYGTKVRFVAVALNKREELQKFLQRKPFGFTHTVANDESVRAFGTTYPRTLIMEENGTIVFDKTGGSVDSYKDIDSELELLLAHKQ